MAKHEEGCPTGVDKRAECICPSIRRQRRLEEKAKRPTNLRKDRLKPKRADPSKIISIRLPLTLIASLREDAQGISPNFPYQTLLRILLRSGQAVFHKTGEVHGLTRQEEQLIEQARRKAVVHNLEERTNNVDLRSQEMARAQEALVALGLEQPAQQDVPLVASVTADSTIDAQLSDQEREEIIEQLTGDFDDKDVRDIIDAL